MSKQNCWEFFNCERRPDGSLTEALGVCPAATETRTDGINSGDNGGRACWALAQTFCTGRNQGSLAEKMSHCMKCEFRKLVVQEEQEKFTHFRDIIDMLKDS